MLANAYVPSSIWYFVRHVFQKLVCAALTATPAPHAFTTMSFRPLMSDAVICGSVASICAWLAASTVANQFTTAAGTATVPLLAVSAWPDVMADVGAAANGVVIVPADAVLPATTSVVPAPGTAAGAAGTAATAADAGAVDGAGAAADAAAGAGCDDRHHE